MCFEVIEPYTPETIKEVKALKALMIGEFAVALIKMFLFGFFFGF